MHTPYESDAKMSQQPPNVKIYDRPESKKFPPVLIALVIALVLVLGYLAYRHFTKPAAPVSVTTQHAMVIRPTHMTAEPNGKLTITSIRVIAPQYSVAV